MKPSTINNGLFKQISLWIVLAIIAILVLTKLTEMRSEPTVTGQREFSSQIEAENIEDPVKVIVGEGIVRIHARFKRPVGDTGRTEISFEYPEFLPGWEGLLNAQDVNVEYARENTMLPSMIFQIVLLLVIIGAFWFFMIRQMQRNYKIGGGMRTRTGKRGEKAILWDDVPQGAAAEAIEESIDKNGRAILAGIVFEFGGTTICFESDNILSATASYLKANPYRTFFVVGHTDPKGAMDFQLSTDRARAVVDALVNDFNIAPDRLEAHGVGPLVPVSNNATDDGRAKNCRVELVER